MEVGPVGDGTREKVRVMPDGIRMRVIEMGSKIVIRNGTSDTDDRSENKARVISNGNIMRMMTGGGNTTVMIRHRTHKAAALCRGPEVGGVKHHTHTADRGHNTSRRCHLRTVSRRHHGEEGDVPHFLPIKEILWQENWRHFPRLVKCQATCQSPGPRVTFSSSRENLELFLTFTSQESHSIAEQMS